MGKLWASIPNDVGRPADDVKAIVVPADVIPMAHEPVNSQERS
jgi:hypothetical protein